MPKSFKDALSLAMEREGMDTPRLAGMLGVHITTVKSWLRGRSVPGDAVSRRLLNKTLGMRLLCVGVRGDREVVARAGRERAIRSRGNLHYGDILFYLRWDKRRVGIVECARLFGFSRSSINRLELKVEPSARASLTHTVSQQYGLMLLGEYAFKCASELGSIDRARRPFEWARKRLLLRRGDLAGAFGLPESLFERLEIAEREGREFKPYPQNAEPVARMREWMLSVANGQSELLDRYHDLAINWPRPLVRGPVSLSVKFATRLHEPYHPGGWIEVLRERT